MLAEGAKDLGGEGGSIPPFQGDLSERLEAIADRRMARRTDRLGQADDGDSVGTIEAIEALFET